MAKMPAGVTIRGKMLPEYRAILTPEALGFVAELHRNFDGERQRLLALREARARRFSKGELPDFLQETRAIRDGGWRVAPIPADLQDRRVEITGPTDRKMIINALNSGARVFMADFEDSNSPVWDNLIRGQINLSDRWSGVMDYRDKDTGKHYVLAKKPAVLMVRRAAGTCRKVTCALTAKSSPARCLISGCIFSTMPRQRFVMVPAHILLAQNGKPFGSTAVEQCFHFCTECAWASLGHHQGHCPYRNPARRI